MILEATFSGHRRVVEVEGADGQVVVHTGHEAMAVRLEPVAGSECWRLVAGGQTIPVRLRADHDAVVATVGAAQVRVEIRRALPIRSRRPAPSGGAERVEVRAPMPGLVVAVPVVGGQEVTAGAVVAVVEAMKMQMDVQAQDGGRVEDVRVRPGQEVAGGQVLAVIRRIPA